MDEEYTILVAGLTEGSGIWLMTFMNQSHTYIQVTVKLNSLFSIIDCNIVNF